MEQDTKVGARRAVPSYVFRNLLMLFLFLCVLMFWSCTPSLSIRHRSQVKRAIHVYINWRLTCKVAPGETCRVDLEPGRYYFYARVPGMPQHAWSSERNPAPFSIDKETVIDLHDPQSAPIRPASSGTQPLSSAPSMPALPSTPSVSSSKKSAGLEHAKGTP